MKSMLLDFSELCFKFMMGNVDITTENESLELLNYTNVEKLIFTLFFFFPTFLEAHKFTK